MVQMGDITIQDEAVLLPNIFIGNFSRDITIASGTQSITGVGFRPQAIQFLSALSGTVPSISAGFDNLTASIGQYNNDNSDPADINVDIANSLFVFSSFNNAYFGPVQSFDVDGFTIDWTKFNSPTGTFLTGFMAFK